MQSPVPQMKFSFYLHRQMFDSKTRYDKVFFKLLLLAVYFAFFTVQIFLRFASPQSKQFLGADDFQKTVVLKTGTLKNTLSNAGSDKNGSSSYLNKHYQPKDVLMIPSQICLLTYFYPEVLFKFYFGKEDITEIKPNEAFLRGPPDPMG